MRAPTPLRQAPTLAHSRARCLVRTALRSSAYSAPMKEPMEVPPTMSMGIPASSIDLITPMWEQPLAEGKQTEERRWGTIRRGNGSGLRSGTPLPAPAQHPPGSAAPQDKGNGVTGEHPCQAGEVAVPIGALLKHLLVHLPLGTGNKG